MSRLEKCDSSWIYLLRQTFIFSTVAVFYFIHGLFVGAPTVIIPQIRREMNSTDSINLSLESWLSSAVFYSSIPWSILLPIVAVYFGRKKTEIILSLDVLISCLMFYLSKSTTNILVSQILVGLLPAAHLSLSCMVLTEYILPRNRGLFITFKSATTYWGVWVSNAIGTFFHWKNIALLSLVCSVYPLTTIFWPESPYWLASKGKYRDCVKAHRWLKGTNEQSEEELKSLIEYHKVGSSEQSGKTCGALKNAINSVTVKTFYKPLALSLLSICLYQVCGKYPCSIYAIRIIKDITVSESTAYNGMLILDGFTVLGMYLGSSLSKVLKRRTLLLGASSIGALFLIFLSCYLYLIDFGVISENAYFSIFLLATYSVSMSCGPILMSLCVSSELTPIKNRSLFLCFLCVLFNTMMGIMLKFSPYLFKAAGLSGSFLFFGLSSFLFIWLLYKYLPETKDKTILEIVKIFEGEQIVGNGENDFILKEQHDTLNKDANVLYN